MRWALRSVWLSLYFVFATALMNCVVCYGLAFVFMCFIVRYALAFTFIMVQVT